MIHNGRRKIRARNLTFFSRIEHSTTDFENTLAIKEKVEAKGCNTIEAPLTGGMQLLREGKMVALVGADADVLDGTMESLIALSAPRIVKW